jgi:glycine oxidase
MTAESFSAGATSDVVIVGGGVIGLTIARALRLRGVREVMLIERGEPGAEASWAAGGILGPQVEADRADDFFELACASRDLYRTFAASLQNETGIDVELDTKGTLYFGFNSHDEDKLKARYEWQTRAGFQVEWLTADDARAIQPLVSDKISCALRFANDFQIENRKLLTALVAANEKLAVKLIKECEVRQVAIERGRVHGVKTSLGFVGAPTVVLAAGAWTSLISAGDAHLPQIEIEPVRGQMLCFKTEGREYRHVLYSERGYLVPRRNGRVLAGSTTEHVGFDRQVTDKAINAIKSMAFEISPSLKRAPLIDSWTGFRPRATDDLPVLGPCADISGLIFATGHYRNGILLAPITGELIADLIVSGEMPARLTPFSPNRFSVTV